jgi:hypothetical protein
MSSAELPARQLPHVTRACDVCRAFKRKCDGTEPCATCVRYSKPCQYSVQPAKRGRKLKRKADEIDAPATAPNAHAHAHAHAQTATASSSSSLSAGDRQLLAHALSSDLSRPSADADGHHSIATAIAARVCPCAVGIFFDAAFMPERCLCGVATDLMPTVRELTERGEQSVLLCPDGAAVLATGAMYNDLVATWTPTPSLRLVAMMKQQMLAHMPQMNLYLQAAVSRIDAFAFVVDRARPDEFEVVFGVVQRGAGADFIAKPLACTGALLDLLGMPLAADDAACDAEFVASERAKLFDRTCPADLASHPAFIKGTAPHLVLRLQLAAQTTLRCADNTLVAAKCAVDLFYSGYDGLLRLVCFKFGDFVEQKVAASEGAFLDTLSLTDDGGVFFTKYPHASSEPPRALSAFDDEEFDTETTTASESRDSLESDSSTTPTPNLSLFWNEDDLEALFQTE